MVGIRVCGVEEDDDDALGQELKYLDQHLVQVMFAQSNNLQSIK